MDVFSKSDPICVVSTKPFGSHNYMEIKRTECIDNNLNPQWVTKVRKRVLQRKSQNWMVFLKNRVRRKVSHCAKIIFLKINLGSDNGYF